MNKESEPNKDSSLSYLYTPFNIECNSTWVVNLLNSIDDGTSTLNYSCSNFLSLFQSLVRMQSCVCNWNTANLLDRPSFCERLPYEWRTNLLKYFLFLSSNDVEHVKRVINAFLDDYSRQFIVESLDGYSAKHDITHMRISNNKMAKCHC